MVYFKRLQVMAAKRPIVRREAAEPSIRAAAQVRDLAQDAFREATNSSRTPVAAPPSTGSELPARSQVTLDTADPVEEHPRAPVVTAEVPSVRADVGRRDQPRSADVETTLSPARAVEEPELAGIVERPPVQSTRPVTKGARPGEPHRRPKAAEAPMSDAEVVALEGLESVGSAAARPPDLELELERSSPAPVSTKATEPIHEEGHHETRRQDRSRQSSDYLESFGDALDLVRRWMSDPAGEGGASRSTPTSETTVPTPGEVTQPRALDASRPPFVPPHGDLAPVAADARPREEHVELSIGTVHITVEEAQTPSRSPRVASTRRARPTAADTPDRHYLRRW